MKKADREERLRLRTERRVKTRVALIMSVLVMIAFTLYCIYIDVNNSQLLSDAQKQPINERLSKNGETIPVSWNDAFKRQGTTLETFTLDKSKFARDKDGGIWVIKAEKLGSRGVSCMEMKEYEGE